MPPKQSSGKQAASRLPNIAPREEQEPNSTEHSSSSTSMYPEVPRTRLPPRSRNGCWTCRMRKVKCDESRPRCQQCARLGHPCDYSPKLAFKDETPKIVDKYVGSGTTSPAWDTNVDPFASAVAASYATAQDSLPPFTSLSTEEDWQRKAEHRRPGTYYVVANSSSFSDVEEYRQREDDSRRSSGPSGGRPDLKTQVRSPNVSLDSETILLGTFEDNPRRPPLLHSNSGVSGTESDGSNPSLTSPSSSLSQGFGRLQVSPEPPDLFESANLDERLRSQLQYQYRTVVRWHILQNHSLLPDISSKIEDAFEREANHYPPLRHALQALSALSLHRQDHSYGVIALQQYQAALGSLKHEQDLASNGSFLTTFVLLLYEIAGTEPFWPYHMNSLKQIIQLRRQTFESEPFPYVVWWTCLVDLNALLSGSGYGPLFLSLIHNNLVPSGMEMNKAPSFLGSAAIFDGDRDLLTAAWMLQREVGIAAARIGEAALQVRATHLHNSRSGNRSPRQIQDLRRQVATMMEMLQHAWQTGWSQALANAVKERRLAEEAYAVFTAARLLYYNCMVFAHTCMWPSQSSEMGPESTNVVMDAARKIVSIIQETIQTRRTERRFAVFPLLLAGTVLPLGDERHQIRNMLSAFERVTLGSNTRATVRLFNSICELHAESGQHAPGLDFLSVVKGRESQLVNFGL